MSSNPYNSKDFKKLQAVWEKKLEQSGFEDIEQADGNLKTWHSEWYKYRSGLEVDMGREEYYRHAGYFLYEYQFKNEMERRIWELHAEGLSIRNIVIALKPRYKKTVYKRKVHEILKPLVKKVIDNAKK